MAGNDLSRTPLSPEDKTAFLNHYRDTANFSESCKAAGRSSRAFQNHRKNDPEFASECETARREAIDKLHGCLWKRAFQGTEEPIMHQGEIVAYKVRHDSQLGMFLLERMAPDEFGRRDRTELTGKGGSPLIPNKMDDIEVARRLAWVFTNATRKKSEILESPKEQDPNVVTTGSEPEKVVH